MDQIVSCLETLKFERRCAAIQPFFPAVPEVLKGLDPYYLALE